MYCNHYKFSEKPFDVTPDPRFLYLTQGHRETLASLIYGIRERRGFITIIGEVGTGKTTLLNAALDRMDEKTRVAFIFNTDVTFNEMLNMALYEWGLIKPKEKLSKVNALQRLNHFAIEQMAMGGNVVLIVDEAQNLDNKTLENLRLLSNLETRRYKLVQIVLSGQPELDTKLGRYELRQLAQRISLKRYVFPLDEKDTYAYLQHRLKFAKHSNSSLFTDKAQKLIWEYSGGVPRKINILCDNAFLIGYGLKKNKINETVVKEAAQDLKWNPFSDTKASLDVAPAETTSFTWVEPKPPRRPLKLTATIIIAVIIAFTGGIFFGGTEFQFAKLTGFISNIKGAALETVHPDPKKQKKQILLSDTPLQADITQKIDTKKAHKKDIEPETRVKKKEVSYLTVLDYQADYEKSPGLIVQDSEVENTWQVTALKENDPSEIQVIDKEKSNLTVPVKEEEIIRQIVVKKGDTLHRIITQTYGAYDDVILKKVQRQNPEIIYPDLILEDQVIKMPAEPSAVGGKR
jgi:general secretion pathway protein A